LFDRVEPSLFMQIAGFTICRAHNFSGWSHAENPRCTKAAGKLTTDDQKKGGRRKK
jgi:hypothetical protein